VRPLTDRIWSCWRVFYRGCARQSRGFPSWRGIARRGHDRTNVWWVLYRSPPWQRRWLLGRPGFLPLVLPDEATVAKSRLSIGHDRSRGLTSYFLRGTATPDFNASSLP
jgi:hypothetical protein